jgi:hypothetical protein
VFASLKSGLEKKGTVMQAAMKAICVPLGKNVDIGFVPKDGWDRYALCRRQLTWFNAESPYYGRFLVISSNRIEEIESGPTVIIRESSLKRPPLPSRTEKLRLTERESYRRARPDAWEDIAHEDPELQARWLKIMGVRGITYKELFITHCANHANFIEPAYFVSEGDRRVPYSIAKTTHVCSACLEFFNIVGSQFNKKLVVPCPGAVLFAGMAPNRYYEVLQPDESAVA